MGEVLRLALVTREDVEAARQLTCDVAREAGMASLGQTKLATVVSWLARHSLSPAGSGMVVFSVVAADEGAPRLIVAVSTMKKAVQGPGPGRVAKNNDRNALGLDLNDLMKLVDDFELTVEPGGGTSVTVAVRLSSEVANDPGFVQRLSLLRPFPSLPTSTLLDLAPSDALTLLEQRSKELEQSQYALELVKAERDAANAELALTNRGVLDLVAELSDANQSLITSGGEYQRLAEQQSALADLGHRAVASHDVAALARDLAGIIRTVLAVQAVGILRFSPGGGSLEVVATVGCEADQPATIDLGIEQARDLRSAATMVAEVPSGLDDALLLAAPGSHSSVVVAVHTPLGPWGVVVACDIGPGSFTTTATDFLEAAASLFAFSIARTASEDSDRHAAFHDGLTGLPNRAQLLDRMDRRFDDKPATPGVGHVVPEMSVVFLDIDGFKQVNDTIGHVAGDIVLIAVAARLRLLTRPTDILARLGGDEFVVVCEGGVEAAAVVAKRLLRAFDDPFVIEGREVFLSGSAGLAPAAASVNSQQILANADIAMYQAKKTPGSATVAFHPELRAMAESESLLHNELRRARDRGQLRAVYEPIFDLGDGTLTAVETLLRWHHPELGEIPDVRAVAAAASVGLDWDLTCWITGEAAGALSAWNAANASHAPLRLAVSFAPTLLTDPVRLREFETCVQAAGLPLTLVDVGLTETAFARPGPGGLASMAELRSLGVRLAMDDFGTGNASLMALAPIPLDLVKIHRTFVATLHPGGDSLLVSAMTQVARGRNLLTIGAGIENEGQLLELIGAGCDQGQGPLLALPLELDQLAGLGRLETTFAAQLHTAREGLTPSTSGALPSPEADGTVAVSDVVVDLDVV